MRISDAVRHNPTHKFLRYLVDVRHGECRAGEAVKFCAGGYSAIIDSLNRAGHADVIASTTDSRPRKDGLPSRGRKIFSESYVMVTPAGRLWRDYIDGDVSKTAAVTSVEWHARIRALEFALRPFAECDAAPSPLAFQIAAEVMNPESIGVLYPWSPNEDWGARGMRHAPRQRAETTRRRAAQ